MRLAYLLDVNATFSDLNFKMQPAAQRKNNTKNYAAPRFPSQPLGGRGKIKFIFRWHKWNPGRVAFDLNRTWNSVKAWQGLKTSCWNKRTLVKPSSMHDDYLSAQKWTQSRNSVLEYGRIHISSVLDCTFAPNLCIALRSEFWAFLVYRFTDDLLHVTDDNQIGKSSCHKEANLSRCFHLTVQYCCNLRTSLYL